MNCNSCPNKFLCRSVRIRHCDGKPYREPSSVTSLRELMSNGYSAHEFEMVISAWSNQKMLSQLKRKVPCHNPSKVFVLNRILTVRGIPAPEWLIAETNKRM